MRRLGSRFHVAMNGMAASDKIFRFLGEKEPGEKHEAVNGEEIEMKDICFSYDGERKILRNVRMIVLMEFLEIPLEERSKYLAKL